MAEVSPVVSEEALLPDEVSSAYAYMPAALAGNLAGMGVVTMLFWRTVAPGLLLGWLLAASLLWTIRLERTLRFRRARVESLDAWRQWRAMWTAGILVSGALWGWTAWVFYTRGSGIAQTGLVISIYTLCIAAIPVMAAQPRMYSVYASLCFVPMTLRVATAGEAHDLQLAGILVLIFGSSLLLLRNYRQAFLRIIALKLQADGLLGEVRREKALAEAARQDAETARRASAQFFGAASHDLRQPLHALGLFAQVLSQRDHAPEVRRLVDHVSASVFALESLFSQILDIHRIDGGGVRVDIRNFTVSEVWEPVRLHFEPMAFEKGLALRFRGGSQRVRGDPVLVERIVRNLVSNALRYTEDGTVLVGARRNGDTVRLQVWDSGVGMTTTEQARVFEPFYRVPGQGHTGESDHGLGLGLAIVKRLAEAQGATIEVHSQPGRGSVFTLELPAASPTSTMPITQLTPVIEPASAVTLAGRSIVLVEDDAAVRTALLALLSDWGVRVHAFDGLSSCATWCAEWAAQSTEPPPDLLIVDHQLGSDGDGREVVAMMRRRFGLGLRAIMVTGNTAPELLRAAANEDFTLIYKPVQPSGLRGAIAEKLLQTG